MLKQVLTEWLGTYLKVRFTGNQIKKNRNKYAVEYKLLAKETNLCYAI